MVGRLGGGARDWSAGTAGMRVSDYPSLGQGTMFAQTYQLANFKWLLIGNLLVFTVTEGHSAAAAGERACAGPCNTACILYMPLRLAVRDWRGRSGSESLVAAGSQHQASWPAEIPWRFGWEVTSKHSDRQRRRGRGAKETAYYICVAYNHIPLWRYYLT